MKKIKRIISIVFIILVIASCLGYVFRSKLSTPFIPTVEQTGDILISVERDTSFVTASFIVTNQFFLKIEIDTLLYKVALLNKTYLQNKKSLGIKLPAYGSDTVDFSLKIPYVAILKDLKTERKKGDSIGYSVDIDLGYSTIFGAAKIPIKKSAKIKIPQPPELKIEQIKWKKIRLKYIQAIARVKIINYSVVNLSVQDIRYTMDISKQGSLQGTYKKAISIRPFGTTFIDLPIEIEIKNIGNTLFKILVDKDTYDYTLALEATLESTIPLEESFHLKLTKSGKIELKK
ncbi:LEA type 2 family protein [Aurantibacillus circumpalustris]|uniref:LEA type 2 family protein n=1 Tax=Aurantibacillus circumpalustris TaxID=3036359 RepID=UPI00295B18FD|nr:LEA type 2 family protein [Aurantibacillus circumpalustris]